MIKVSTSIIRICIGVGVIFGALGGASAIAAQISVNDIPGKNFSIVSLEGAITDGDADNFYEAVDNLKKVMVILESPGGKVREALSIGAEIRLRDFSTMVGESAECYSACGFIWVAGTRRYMSPSSRIGFHAAFIEENGEYKESGIANAEIGSFLTHLGLRIEAIRFFTISGPTELLLLTPELARGLGIEIHELVGGELITPSQNPVVDVYVDRFVAFSFLQSRCLAFLQPTLSATDHGAETAFEKGNEMVGSKHWVKLLQERLDVMKREISSKGALLHCLDTEAELRSEGLSTGIDGPSFGCSSNRSSTQRAICADKDLWAKDRAMNAIYLYIRTNIAPGVRKRLLAVQRDWLGFRDRCDGNRRCLNEVYDQRLQELREFDFPS